MFLLTRFSSCKLLQSERSKKLQGLYIINVQIYKILESYSFQSEVKLFVNRLNTEESIIPFEYHHFDFCQADESKSPVENLGQVVFGERIRPSPYKIDFLVNQSCTVLCRKNYVKGKLEDMKKLTLLKKGMSLNYQHHWIVDNMPVTWCYTVEGIQYCNIGFPMGCYSKKAGITGYSCSLSDAFNKPNTFYLVNHVDLVITYHSGKHEDWGMDFQEDGGRIISVKVHPRSVQQIKDPK